MAAQYPIANEEKYSHNGKPKNIPLNKISAIHNIEKRKLSQYVKAQNQSMRIQYSKRSQLKAKTPRGKRNL